MTTTLFDSYSVRGKIFFFKTIDCEEKITIAVGVNANHQVDKNIYEKLNEFLEKLLIDDYITEDQHNAIKLHEKQQEQAEKHQAKYIKEKEKELKKMKVKVPKAVKKVKSLY